jgi:hypothetical protein
MDINGMLAESRTKRENLGEATVTLERLAAVGDAWAVRRRGMTAVERPGRTKLQRT